MNRRHALKAALAAVILARESLEPYEKPVPTGDGGPKYDATPPVLSKSLLFEYLRRKGRISMPAYEVTWKIPYR